MNGINALMRETPKSSPALSTCEDSLVCNLESHQNTTILALWAGTSSLQNCKKKILLFISHRVSDSYSISFELGYYAILDILDI